MQKYFPFPHLEQHIFFQIHHIYFKHIIKIRLKDIQKENS